MQGCFTPFLQNIFYQNTQNLLDFNLKKDRIKLD